MLNDFSSPPLWVRCSVPLIKCLPVGRYVTMNALCNFFSRLVGTPKPFSAITSLGYSALRFHCDLRDSIAREVCFTGHYEPQETLLIQHFLEEEMVFVDVGANWGYFTLLGADQVGPRGTVVSLEPDPRLFALLNSNISLNRFSQVRPLELAATDAAQTLTLHGYHEEGRNWGVSTLTPNNLNDEKLFQIRSSRLDEVLDDLKIEHVDLLKMDIEGAEDLALQGMADGLRTHRYRRLLIELHPAHLAERGIQINRVLEPLQRAGYRGAWIDHRKAANRKAAYRRQFNFKDFLLPMESCQPLDAWPHTFWVSPGLSTSNCTTI